MWNNRHELTLIGDPVHGPLFHSRECMEWYMANSIYFLLVSHLLNDSRTQLNPPPEHTFPLTSNYNHPQEDPCRHSFAAATDYYPPQQQLYRHSFASEQFNTPQWKPIMDDRRQSIVSSSTDFFYNLFRTYLNTPPSANDHMQYMHPTHFDSEAGSSSATIKMNNKTPQFESNDEPQPQQPQSP